MLVALRPLPRCPPNSTSISGSAARSSSSALRAGNGPASGCRRVARFSASAAATSVPRRLSSRMSTKKRPTDHSKELGRSGRCVWAAENLERDQGCRSPDLRGKLAQLPVSARAGRSPNRPAPIPMSQAPVPKLTSAPSCTRSRAGERGSCRRSPCPAGTGRMSGCAFPSRLIWLSDQRDPPSWQRA